MMSNGLDSWIESGDFHRLVDQISPDVLKRVREAPLPPSSLFEENPVPTLAPAFPQEEDIDFDPPDSDPEEDARQAVAPSDLQLIRSRLASLNAQARASGILESKKAVPVAEPMLPAHEPARVMVLSRPAEEVQPLEWDDLFLEELEQFSQWATRFIHPIALWITDPRGHVVRAGGTPLALTRATQRFTEATFRLGEDLPAARRSTVYVALGPERWLGFLRASSSIGSFHLQLLLQAPPPYEMMATVQIAFGKVLREKDQE